MMFWVYLWKILFIFTVLAFAVMAVWVTIQGAFDIKAMMATLRKRHEAQGEEAARK